MEKINLILSWCGDDFEKNVFSGVQKKDDDKYLVDIDRLASHLNVLPRSIAKNFQLSGYSRMPYIVKGRTIFYKKSDNQNDRPIALQAFPIQNVAHPKPIFDDLSKLDANGIWSEFTTFSPQHTLESFTDFIEWRETGGFLSPITLFEILGCEAILKEEHFYSLIHHFGPMLCLKEKIMMWISSALCRRFGFGKEIQFWDKMSGVFTVEKNGKAVEICNTNRDYGNTFLKTESGEFMDLEEFWERSFPECEPSEDIYRDKIINFNRQKKKAVERHRGARLTTPIIQ